MRRTDRMVVQTTARPPLHKPPTKAMATSRWPGGEPFEGRQNVGPLAHPGRRRRRDRRAKNVWLVFHQPLGGLALSFDLAQDLSPHRLGHRRARFRVRQVSADDVADTRSRCLLSWWWCP